MLAKITNKDKSKVFCNFSSLGEGDWFTISLDLQTLYMKTIECIRKSGVRYNCVSSFGHIGFCDAGDNIYPIETEIVYSHK